MSLANRLHRKVMIRKKLIDRGLGDTLAALGGARLGRLAGLTYML